jgi:hypothetical protein
MVLLAAEAAMSSHLLLEVDLLDSIPTANDDDVTGSIKGVELSQLADQDLRVVKRREQVGGGFQRLFLLATDNQVFAVSASNQEEVDKWVSRKLNDQTRTCLLDLIDREPPEEFLQIEIRQPARGSDRQVAVESVSLGTEPRSLRIFHLHARQPLTQKLRKGLGLDTLE